MGIANQISGMQIPAEVVSSAVRLCQDKKLLLLCLASNLTSRREICYVK